MCPPQLSCPFRSLAFGNQYASSAASDCMEAVPASADEMGQDSCRSATVEEVCLICPSQLSFPFRSLAVGVQSSADDYAHMNVTPGGGRPSSNGTDGMREALDRRDTWAVGHELGAEGHATGLQEERKCEVLRKLRSGSAGLTSRWLLRAESSAVSDCVETPHA